MSGREKSGLEAGDEKSGIKHEHKESKYTTRNVQLRSPLYSFFGLSRINAAGVTVDVRPKPECLHDVDVFPASSGKQRPAEVSWVVILVSW